MDAILRAAVPEVQYVDLEASCAQADFGFNALGIRATLDLYQPHHGEILVDANFDNCQRDSRYQVAAHTLGAEAGSCDYNTMGPM